QGRLALLDVPAADDLLERLDRPEGEVGGVVPAAGGEALAILLGAGQDVHEVAGSGLGAVEVGRGGAFGLRAVLLGRPELAFAAVVAGEPESKRLILPLPEAQRLAAGPHRHHLVEDLRGDVGAHEADLLPAPR